MFPYCLVGSRRGLAWGGPGALLGLAGGGCGKACCCTPSASAPWKPRASVLGHSPVLTALGARLAIGWGGAGRLAAPLWEPRTSRRLSRRGGAPGVAAGIWAPEGWPVTCEGQHPDAAPPDSPQAGPGWWWLEVVRGRPGLVWGGLGPAWGPGGPLQAPNRL